MQMKYLMLLGLLLVPVTLADISLTTDLKDEYNLGDSIIASFDIEADDDMDALFKINMVCESFDINYYTLLINIDASEKAVINPPPIRAIKRMKGACRLRALVETLDSSVLEDYQSDKFEITDQLALDADIANTTALPGQTIEIKGNVYASFDNFDGLFALISFDGEQYNLSVDDTQFDSEIPVKGDIGTGEHLLFLEMIDSFGNNGDMKFYVNVNPIPTNIGIDINKKLFRPEESLKIKAALHDQAGERIIDSVINVQLSKGKNIVFTKSVFSNQEIEHVFSKYADPGKYEIKTTYDNIGSEVSVIVEEVKKLDVNLEGHIVHVSNIGNVVYNEPISLNLLGQDNKDMVDVQINLAPGESTEVDLSKYVKEDSYSVEFVAEEETKELAAEVPIEDNRPLFNRITGFFIATGDAGSLNMKSMLALVLVVAIIAAVVVSQIKRRKL